MPTIRLDKFLSNAGVMSRRGIKQLLKEQHLSVNGKKITESGTRIQPDKDKILLNGKAIRKPEHVYFALNKPKGVISTTADEFTRDNVVDLIDTEERIYPIGRLDKETHGLLILSNDGELTHKLIHPKYHVPKIYLLKIAGRPKEEQLEAFRTGVLLNDGITLPAPTTVIRHKDHQTTLKVILHEGRNRQIRRMCEIVGMELLDLQRISFGPIQLHDLPLGSYRPFTKEEVKLLKKAVSQT